MMKIKVIKGDITTLAVDAIVNAANNELLPGGGVCGAIHRAAGPDLEKACADLGGCETGRAVVTHGFLLTAKYIIHAVGPIYRGQQPQDGRLLANAYLRSLNLAEMLGIRSIAFPCIGTGIYGYPPDEACGIAVEVARRHRAQSLESIIFCCFSDADFDRYQKEMGL